MGPEVVCSPFFGPPEMGVPRFTDLKFPFCTWAADPAAHGRTHRCIAEVSCRLTNGAVEPHGIHAGTTLLPPLRPLPTRTPPSPATRPGTEVAGNSRAARLTVAALANAKRLPADFLTRLGLSDLPEGSVGIPYYDATGAEVAVKRGLSGDRIPPPACGHSFTLVTLPYPRPRSRGRGECNECRRVYSGRSRSGLTLRGAADVAGVHVATVCRWQQRDPGLKAALARAAREAWFRRAAPAESRPRVRGHRDYPLCKARVVVRTASGGRRFWRCGRWPACPWASWRPRAPRNCRRCGGVCYRAHSRQSTACGLRTRRP
jgi:hypothetical protein